MKFSKDYYKETYDIVKQRYPNVKKTHVTNTIKYFIHMSTKLMIRKKNINFNNWFIMVRSIKYKYYKRDKKWKRFYNPY